MAYDEFLADRIRLWFKNKIQSFSEKKMMGGLCFLVNDKMFCGIHIDKKLGTSLLMARVGQATAEKLIVREECLPMDFTGRPMKHFLFIRPQGFDLDENLDFWLQKCLEFNPFAKPSRKK